MKNLIFFFFFFFFAGQSWSQFNNPGFENVTCPSDCSTASSKMNCVEDWWLANAAPSSAPLMKSVCNETVCSGEYSVLLSGGSGGGGVAIETNNPFWGASTALTPSAILLQANILPSSDIGTGIRIAGWNGTSTTPLGFLAPNVMNQCVEMAIPVTPNITNFQFLRIYTGMETGHLDSHSAVVDNFTMCEELFLIEEECGEITVSVNCDIELNLGILEVFDGTNSSILWEDLPVSFTVDQNGVYMFNIFYDINGTTELVKFNYTVTTADEICCDETLICSEETDLTACADEGNFGYIHLSCDAATNISFDWSFPSGSTASEFSCDNHSILTEVSEGSYTVTITDQTGCEEIREYKVTEDCCKPSCPIPTNLGCNFETVKMLLTWDPVPEAIGYEVSIIINDKDCCGPGIGESLIPKFTAATNLVVNSLQDKCFSWRVRTVCRNELKSAYSQKVCFANKECYKPFKVEVEVGTGVHTLKPQIAPNPTNGPVTFLFEAPSKLSLQLDILTSEGKVVKTFGEKTYDDGRFRMDWDVNGNLKDGIYYCVFKTNFGTFNDKLVVFDAGEE